MRRVATRGRGGVVLAAGTAVAFGCMTLALAQDTSELPTVAEVDTATRISLEQILESWHGYVAPEDRPT
jgi:hypothetical protein